MLTINKRERRLLISFLSHDLDIIICDELLSPAELKTNQDRKLTFIDWLRQINNGDRDFFLECCTCDVEVYDLLAKIIKEDEKVKEMVDMADDIIDRVAWLAGTKAHPTFFAKQDQRIDRVVLIIIGRFQRYALADILDT